MTSFKKIFKNKWLKYSSIAVVTVILVFFGLYGSIYIGLWGKIPNNKELATLKQSQASLVLDKDHQLIGKYYIYDRESITYNDLPQHLINALIATEDARFYEHDGVDNRSLLRVFFKTILMSDKSSGGGSTITLQLAKNLFGRKDYGYISIVVNKLKESIIAKRLEEIYSKQEILTMYFNTVPFSDNTYGIESASQKFFNKHTRELSLSESATLVGTLKANHSYNPRLFPERSQLRRDVVLQQMEKYGYISQKQQFSASQEKIKLDYQYYSANDGLAPYFREQVKRKVSALLNEKEYQKPDGEAYNIYTDGLKIYTTLDSKLQHYAEAAMQEHMKKLQAQYEKAYGHNAPWLTNKKLLTAALQRLDKYKELVKAGVSEQEIKDSLAQKSETEVFNWNNDEVVQLSTLDSLQYYAKFLNTGMVSLDPSSGAVRAYIGGIDHRFFKYDHVSQSKRQVGSTFKPIVYTTALEQGMDPCTYFPVREVTYTDVDNWTPKNASNKEQGEHLNYSLKAALSKSINTIAVKVLYQTGIDNVLEEAHKMGIKTELPNVPSIALGTCDLSVMELAKAYTSFVNNSIPSTPYLISKIEDKHGNLIVDFTKENQTQHTNKEEEMAFSQDTRQTMIEMLKETVNSGTAKRLRTQYHLPNDMAGKTGTTQDNKDGWFVGILPNLVTVVWVGNDDHRIGFSNTAIGQGANSALPIFGLLMQKLNSDHDFNTLTQAHFEKPSDEVLAALDCEPTKEDGFFKRIFGNKKDEKKFHKKKKKGFFSFLKGRKDKKEND